MKLGIVTAVVYAFPLLVPGAVEKGENILVNASTGIVFGDFLRPPHISLWHHPEVDYKRFLDMQVHFLATNPVFEGLGCVGYWGSHTLDEEMMRWCFDVLRHYAVEGHTEPLSDRCGFAYLPGHVKDPDFREGLAAWTASGGVKGATHKDLGEAEGRWGGNGHLGDTCAEFHRGTDATGRLAQKVTGLQPGRRYRFECITADPKLYGDKRHEPKSDGIGVSLGKGAEIVRELSWKHDDRINVRHIVFRATAPETTLAFDDEAAKPGETTLLNNISIVPYYNEN